jgi:uncharacterized phiE125 gp8 family phage protein
VFDLIDTAESLVTGPVREPLDLEEVKKALRITSETEHTLLVTWMAAARQYFEVETGRQVMLATWEYHLDEFPVYPAIEVPRPPLVSVESISYLDEAGVTQTMDPADYTVHTAAGPLCPRGRISIPHASVWPTSGEHQKAVTIRYQAGYGEVYDSVPELIKGTLLLIVGVYYQFRANVYAHRGGGLETLPMGVEPIVRAFRETAIQTLAPRRAC